MIFKSDLKINHPEARRSQKFNNYTLTIVSKSQWRALDNKSTANWKRVELVQHFFEKFETLMQWKESSYHRLDWST